MPDKPPADARFCPSCGEALSPDHTGFVADRLLNVYRAPFACPNCGYRGEVIRHDIRTAEDEPGEAE